MTPESPAGAHPTATDGSPLLDTMAAYGCEQLVMAHDAPTGLRAIVAIHSTALGPAIGGTRFLPYPDEAAAALDVCRLAQGMTYKQAAAGLAAGGGKAVIIGDPRTARTEALVRAYARVLDDLGGRYLTAEDVGTTQDDMDLIRSVTPHVTGCREELGGSGDPSPATAWGVMCALRTVGRRLWGAPEPEGRHVVVSGVGKVGADLVDQLVAAGARVTIADVRADRVAAVTARHPHVAVVAPEEAHRVPADVWSPSALGAVIDATTIPELGAAAVCGCANNQLAAPTDGPALAAAGVLYAPDFVVNAGGVINIGEERRPDGLSYDRARAWEAVARIEQTLATVFARADAEGSDPNQAAIALAEDRIAAAADRGRP